MRAPGWPMVGLGCLAIIAGGGYARSLSSRAPGARWQTVTVTRADVQVVVTATGSLQPLTISPVGAQVSGIVMQVHADFNAAVKEGDVLAVLDPALFRNAVAQAQAALVAARANENKARASLADAERIRGRAAELARDHFGAQADADTAQFSLDGARAALEATSAAVLQARAALDRARLDLEHTAIRAPVTGTVIARSVEVGQAVASSFTAPTLFTVARDLTKMHVHASVDEADLGQVRVGQAATFTVDAFRGRKFKGQVSQIRDAAQLVQNVVTYDVVINVDNADLELRPGMTANVRLNSAAHAGVLTIPNGALRFKPPAEMRKVVSPDEKKARRESQATVYVPEGERMRPVEVEVGISDGVRTEIGGLSEGAEVIVDAARGDREQSPAVPKKAMPRGL